MSEEVLYETLSEILLEKSKPKIMKGSLVLGCVDVSSVDEGQLQILDESLNFKSSQKESKEYVKQMSNFGMKFGIPFPALDPVHNLYVYPTMANFTSYPAKYGKAKNILARVYFLKTDNDTDIRSRSIPAIFGRSSSPAFIDVIQLAMVWNNRRPSFMDEVKIKLPYYVTSSYHILFSFHNINMNKNKEEQDRTLGYAVLPIFANERIIDDSTHVISITKSLVKAYLTNKEQDYVDGPNALKNPQTVLHVSTRLNSSLFSQDKALNDFVKFNHVDIGKNKKLWEELLHVDRREIIKFFPIILNSIFDHMIDQPSKDNQQLAFRTLAKLVDIINTETRSPTTTEKYYYNPHLTAYVEYKLKNSCSSSSDSGPTFNVIIVQWSILLSESGLDPEVRKLADLMIDKYSYFYFQCIIKSMTLHLNDNDLLQAPRDQRLTKSQLSSITNLIEVFGGLVSSERVTRSFNRHLAYFFVELFDVIDRGYVFTLINRYLSHLKEANEMRLSLDLFKVITDYEHYIPLCLPIQTPVDTCESLLIKFWKNHYLSGHLLNIILTISLDKSSNKEERKANRRRAIKVLRNVLFKHEFDPRYQIISDRKLIANLYIPQLRTTVLLLEKIIKTEEKQDWLACFLHILCWADPALIRQWLFMESAQNRWQFLRSLGNCITTFKDKPGILEMSHTVTIWLEYFMRDFHKELHKEENLQHIEILSQYILTLLKIVKDEYYLFYLHLTIRNLFFRFRLHIFRRSTSNFTLDCCFELLSHSYDLSDTLARGSLSLLYSMMKANYFENGEFLRMKLALTVAASKLTTEQIKTLPYICDNFLCYTRADSSPGLDWELHVKDLMGRLYRISVYTLVISDQSYNNELRIDVIKELADECNHSIDLRIKYLQQLAKEHEKHKNFLQVGLCKVTAAGIISKFLKMKMKDECPPLPSQPACYSDIVPNIIYELPVRSMSVIEVLSPGISETGYFSLLDEALEAFQTAQLFELALVVTKILYDYNLSMGRYPKLSDIGVKISNWGKKAATIIQAESRMFSNFYRVGFYGKKFGVDFNQKQYIYCVPPSERLGDLTARLLSDYAAELECEVKTLPNKPVEELVLDPEGHYLQIISVDALTPHRLLHSYKKRVNIL
eukprot:TRINITY_DN1517_c0_g1_i1.p1 TRINITY_DN1517_c0_g1~~TRINITY_DN1517_c0_g1_i1.p1  ORF type:complete len:1213 (-),score=223.50 TRINITY_DN1517_c0_g1_i1:872-4249(-)